MTGRLRGAALLAAILVAAACGTSGPTSSTAATPATSPSLAAELTPVPGGPTSAPVEPSGTPTQTDTDWGRIWDAVPDSFPRPGTSIPADVGGPVSAAFSVGSGPEEAVMTMQAGLDGAGYSTDRAGHLEDGSIVLDSTGVAGCQVQTKLTPLSGTTLMTVMFGASCPFE
jgi:hypothetical protein